MICKFRLAQRKTPMVFCDRMRAEFHSMSTSPEGFSVGTPVFLPLSSLEIGCKTPILYLAMVREKRDIWTPLFFLRPTFKFLLIANNIVVQLNNAIFPSISYFSRLFWRLSNRRTNFVTTRWNPCFSQPLTCTATNLPLIVFR